MPHLETAITLMRLAELAVTRDVLEGVAALPLAPVSTDIPLHFVMSGEAVPGAEEVDRLHRGMRLTIKRKSVMARATNLSVAHAKRGSRSSYIGTNGQIVQPLS